MRARQRHFNAGQTGANFCLDSRFGFDLADNSDVSTWDDRSANNADATQATAAYKPKYRTAIIGGQPALEFLPTTNNQKFVEGAVTITTTSATTIFVLNMDSGCPDYGRAAGFSKGTSQDHDSLARMTPCLRNASATQLASWSNNAARGAINISSGTWYHWTSVFDGSNATNRLNESTSATTAIANSFDITKYRVGLAYDATVTPGSASIVGAWKGYIAYVCNFSSAISASLRRRIQNSNAYSFKIACS